MIKALKSSFCVYFVYAFALMSYNLVHFVNAFPKYDLQPLKVEVFYPKGFQISIPGKFNRF